MAHDEHHHAGFHRAYNSITSSLYIRNLSRRLKQYITHCPKCLHYQTVRHAPYGALQPIVGPPIPFHTVTADFILGCWPRRLYDGHLQILQEGRVHPRQGDLDCY